MLGGRFAVTMLALVGGCLSKPERPSDDCLVAISGQGGGTCVLDGSGELWCWGHNVGDGTATDRGVPVSVQLGGDASAVAVGEFHTCAVTNGEVRCWGRNDLGQVGDGTLIPADTPTRAGTLDDAIAVATGQTHSCAVRAGGSVACWGGNTYGALGDGAMADRAEPGPVLAIVDAVEVTIGDYATCARLAGGTVACWGDNQYGLLGDGTLQSRSLPDEVPNLTGVTGVSAGCHLHVCAVRDDGAVWCWGRNDRGQLGDGSTTDSSSPILAQVPEGAVEVSVGGQHTCARSVSDRVYCWGGNDVGQLGLDTVGADVLLPALVPAFGPGGAKAIATGCYHTCAVNAGDEVLCWGAGNIGQLGDGTFADRPSPAPVQSYCMR